MAIFLAKPGVFISNEAGILAISSEQINEVAMEAANTPRRRARLCAHGQDEALVHEMLIALRRESYVRPHRHPGKSESFHVITGEATVVVFTDEGAIRQIIRMGDYRSGQVFYYRLELNAFHTVLTRSDIFIFHEVTNGPFRPADTQFAPWAPPESEANQAEVYLSSLAERIYGAQKAGDETV